MALTPGTRLGVFELIAPIGRGGMGEVYRARDTKLDRDVAIKVLPEAFAHDADRLARFLREAKTLASLNHPNIAIIHGLEESGGVRALVMELVEGDDLSQRIARGAIPLDEALPIAKQVADALEAAHEQGVIHRDLKPANIKVRADGTVKVLDFGLAKAMEPAAGASPSMSMAPTITTPAMMTGVGMILGTAAYMSPEQARGKTVDKRADIWAFGCVLYEMLTGRPAFDGDDVQDILGSVLKSEPDWTRLPLDVPLRIRELLRLCLEKNAKNRRSDATDVRLDIEQALAEPVAAMPTVAPARDARLAWMALLAVAMAVIVALAIPAVRHLRETPPPEMRVELNTPSTPRPIEFALSPDGRHIVFVASGDGPQRLWLRSLDKADAQPMAGTDGAAYPFWSADSRSIGFFAMGNLFRIDIAGGPPQALANAAGPVVANATARGGAWNADGTILFARSSTSPLSRIAASGGEPVDVTQVDPRQTSHRFPHFLPDGRYFLFYAQGGPETSGIYLGSLDGGEPRRLTAADTAGASLQPDWLVFVRQGALVARRLNLARGELTSDPVTLADPVAYDGATGLGGFSVSADGRLAYRAAGAVGRQLLWFDRTGKAVGVAGEPDVNSVLAPELSPDGRRVAIDRMIQGNRDVWLMDLARGGLTRFTFDAATDGLPLWSPDGSRIAFESSRKGSFDIWLKPSNGAGMEELLLGTPNNEWPLSWSKDGRFLLYFQDGGKTGADLWALPVTGEDRKPIMVANTPFDERAGEFSPDGRWVAYDTTESGRFEIVVQPFPKPTGKWQVSTSGGSKPRWRTDGKEIYFIAPDGKLMAVPVTAQGSAFEAGTQAALFPTRILSVPSSKHQYTVSRDGRFLINQSIEESATSPITLILNWKPPAN